MTVRAAARPENNFITGGIARLVSGKEVPMKGRNTMLLANIRKTLRRFTALMSAAILALGAGTSACAQESSAAPVNGAEIVGIDFDDGGTDGFTIYNNGGVCEIANRDGSLAVDIKSCGNLDYANQVYWDGFQLLQGCEYTYRFDIRSDIERQVEYRLQLNGGDYHAYQSGPVQVTPEMQTVSVDFVMNEESDPAPRIVFNMGKMADMDSDPGPHSVFIDNVSLTIKDASGAQVLESLPEYPLVNLSQIGYRPSDPKYLVLKEDSEEGSFAVIDESTGESVYKGRFEKPFYDRASDTRVKKADFTDLDVPGTYHIHVESGDVSADSYPFVIGDDVYDSLYRSILTMLYLQRCGCEVGGETAGAFTHPACHTGEALIYGTDRTKDVSGGWHDAGDYGRYVVSGAKAVADLMLAYEEYDLSFDDLGIPESGNGVPDVLDEICYELDWLLKMQDPETGGVYHKVTGYAFPGEVMPEAETEQLVLAPISTAATGDFAAVMAKASVLYREIDPAFAAAALDAAGAAWKYVKDLDDSTGFVNPGDISTGEYPDRGTDDEIFWAAVELYLAGEEVLSEEISARYSSYLRSGLGWNRMGSYAMYDLAAASPEALSDVAEACREQLVAAADELVKNSEKDAYGMALEKSYPWGSNMSVANNGIQLLMAETLTDDSSYRTLAKEQLDYLLGNNALGYCFVTGFGSHAPQHPHHRPSQAVGSAMPGMLVGGPDSNLEDPYAKGVLSGQPAAMCYVDHEQSYSTNEVTIYWNSPLICLLSAFL